jgi:hypothetical protein
MDIRTVESLPVFDQSQYPQIPNIPESHFLMLPSSVWQNAEKEWAIGTLITGCVRAGEWKPIDTKTYVNLINTFPMWPRKQDIVNAFWWFIENNDLEIVEFEGTQYVIIPPSTAHNALKGRIMYI